MNFDETLKNLCVHEELLTSTEREQLRIDGYVLLENLLDSKTIETMNQVIDRLFEQEGKEAGKEYIQEEGIKRLAALYNKDAIFDQIFTHPKILAATYSILQQPFYLNLLNVRDVYKGKGEQIYHSDWGPRKDNNVAYAVNSIWMLDNFTNENGATKLIPGTHVLDTPSVYELSKITNQEVQITGKAGSVLIFNAHLWHAGTQNKTDLRRRCIHNFYCVASSKRKIHLSPSVRKQKDKATLSILGGIV
ncbi:phytanoyl-CoA dioxygenase family protein [Sporosarcina sp. Marseille-Q4943]|uniref:phytanoyl-CoA dioxygenase family protein n=1 Tax=Sporosarcina sp. Marseille-Q4943 TaxID=2942204 RepID=UPI00208DA913|nr:phytanoyl-CoA dioxygenase family protein [Sporosarcina sp. Marseille-Q4943]